MERSAEFVNKIINDLLKRYDLEYNEPCWVVKESSLGGLGIFASRDIQVGEDIFKDYPIIIGTRTITSTQIMCVVCFTIQEKMCTNKCGLPVCEKCSNSTNHQKECKFIRSRMNEDFNEVSMILYQNFTPLRGFFLNEKDKQVLLNLKAHNGQQHEFEIDLIKDQVGLKFDNNEEDFLRHVCKVLDANAFELVSGTEENNVTLRGLYPLASLANHSCVPNTMHVFDKNHVMIKRASNFIQKGEEITHSYTRLIWSTPTRQYNLYRTKHFHCKCRRCLDPTEFETYMSAFICRKCHEFIVPLNPTNLKSNWCCIGCQNQLKSSDISHLFSLTGSILSSFTVDDVELMKKFVEHKLAVLVSPCNQTAVEIKYKLIWIIGYNEKFLWKDLSMDLLNFKISISKELLDLLGKLKLGECKMKGLLLSELYKCYKELIQRIKQISNKNVEGVSYYQNTELLMDNTLQQAARILRDDTAAPPEIITFNENNNKY